MRQWHLNPKYLCRKHLLGEHVEHHMFFGALKKRKNLTGYIKKGLVEIETLEERHEELVEEMTKRGYNHNSPLEIDKKFLFKAGKINKQSNFGELFNRCPECRKNMEKDFKTSSKFNASLTPGSLWKVQNDPTSFFRPPYEILLKEEIIMFVEKRGKILFFLRGEKTVKIFSSLFELALRANSIKKISK